MINSFLCNSRFCHEQVYIVQVYIAYEYEYAEIWWTFHFTKDSVLQRLIVISQGG